MPHGSLKIFICHQWVFKLYKGEMGSNLCSPAYICVVFYCFLSSFKVLENSKNTQHFCLTPLVFTLKIKVYYRNSRWNFWSSVKSTRQKPACLSLAKYIRASVPASVFSVHQTLRPFPCLLCIILVGTWIPLSSGLLDWTPSGAKRVIFTLIFFSSFFLLLLAFQWI